MRAQTSGGAVLCVDVGSTFTKGALVDASTGELLATAAHRTTLPAAFPGGSPGGDVLDGGGAVRAAVEERAGVRAGEVLACSSAGGGLRIAVVGYERLVTAEAGRRVALSAGGRVVHVHAGALQGPDVDRLRAGPGTAPGAPPPAPTWCCSRAAPTAGTRRCCCTARAGSGSPGYPRPSS